MIGLAKILSRQRAYTLLEMLACLSIVALFAFAVVPSWYAWLGHSQADSVIYRLMGAINLARSHAIKNRITVSLCPRGHNNECGEDWSQGWLVFQDHQGKGTRDDNDAIIRSDAQLPQGAKLSWQAFPSSHYLRISPSGFMLEQNGCFLYQAKQHNNLLIRRLIVSKTARARLEG